MTYTILDEETQIHKRFKRKANPFLPENYIVARGWKHEGDPRCSAEFYKDADSVKPFRIPKNCTVIVAHNAKFELLYEWRFSRDEMQAFFKRGGRIWCTQYAEYLLNAQQQKYHMNSLDDTAPTYGGRTKIDGMKELWEAGVQTADIPKDMVLDYLIGTEEEGRDSGDIGNTELIYLGQIKAAEELGMLTAIKVRMDGLCATADMEFNGLRIDMKRAKGDFAKRTVELEVANRELDQYITDMPDGLVFNWNSPIMKSCLIFGGNIKYSRQETYIDEKTGELARLNATEAWPLFNKVAVDPRRCSPGETEDHPLTFGQLVQDTFKGGKKAGEPKFKNVTVQGELKVKFQDFFHECTGYTIPLDEWLGSQTDGLDGPVYSTNSDVIETLTKRNMPFTKALGTVNRLNKELGTYYLKVNPKNGEKTGMLTCVQPWDHIIHPKLNHSSTITSRLSSSDPNLQNLTRADFDSVTGLYKSEVKGMFISRFDEKYCTLHDLPVVYEDDGSVAGQMIEIDYSQLEVVVQGLLSGDVNLCRDLVNRVDFHCKRVALKNDITYEEALEYCKNEDHPEHAKWKKERTKCKIFSFQRAYGAGAALIAAETGMDIDEVKALIEVEEKEYPGITKFNNAVEAEVNETAEPFRDWERGNRVFRRGTYQTPTGTLYTFRSYDAPEWMKKRGVTDTFSPTELKNYPVQGTGGELVQMILGQLWRWFVKNDNFNNMAFLCNTVHDCVWADCHPHVRDRVAAGMNKIMQAIPYFLKKFFGIISPVPFPVDVEVGRDMLDMHHWVPKEK
jgi:DNA polymerase I-like protein with 3'-5' exonuclease and polymerase domains